jgi:hypothetical protein
VIDNLIGNLINLTGGLVVGSAILFAFAWVVTVAVSAVTSAVEGIGDWLWFRKMARQRSEPTPVEPERFTMPTGSPLAKLAASERTTRERA